MEFLSQEVEWTAAATLAVRGGWDRARAVPAAATADGAARVAKSFAGGSVARGFERDAVGRDVQFELGECNGGGGEAAGRADVQRAVAELGVGVQPGAEGVGGVDDHEDRDEVHAAPLVRAGMEERARV